MNCPLEVLPEAETLVHAYIVEYVRNVCAKWGAGDAGGGVRE